VYRARDRKLHRDIALKILPAPFAADVERLTRFEREARALAALNHPHIAQIHGLEHLVERKRTTGDARGEVVPLHQLHHQRISRTRPLHSIHVRDVRMIPRGKELRFSFRSARASQRRSRRPRAIP